MQHRESDARDEPSERPRGSFLPFVVRFDAELAFSEAHWVSSNRVSALRVEATVLSQANRVEVILHPRSDPGENLPRSPR